MGMKNGAVVTAWLDGCAELYALKAVDKEAFHDRLGGDEHAARWQACLDAGWTVAELDAAYARRFERKVDRQSVATS